MTDTEALLRLAVAALGGLAVGIEREWSARRDKDHSRFGGVRTFLLLGLVGSVSALIAGETGWVLGAMPLAGAALLVVVAYLISAWQGTIDATTEVAGMVVVAAGVLAGAGRLTLASAIFAATALVLFEKGRMHAAVERLRTEELQAAARFAVLALVVLPLLPAEPIAELGGLAPRKLWSLVLLFSGLSFAGYVALRAAGPKRGLGLAGLLGGIVSSTASTLNFARESRTRDDLAQPLALAALASSAVMPLRVALLSVILNRDVAWALAPVVGAALVVSALFVLRAFWGRDEGNSSERVLPANPLRLGAAIQMTVVFAGVLWLLALAEEHLGSIGLLTGAALLGLTDLDALTFSMNRLASGSLGVESAARALTLGMLANTLFKATAAAILGSARFRLTVVAGLALFAAIFALGFVLLGSWDFA